MNCKQNIMLLLISLFTLAVNAQKRPNIIFLLTDDQTQQTLGCYGNKQVQTPNLDKLAQQGALFMNHYNTTAICMASRAIIFTGMPEYKNGCDFEHGPLHPDKFAKSYPMLLKKNGYFVGYAGKFGVAVTYTGNENPNSFKQMPISSYDEWAGGTGMTTYKTSDNKYMAKYEKEYPHTSRAYGAWAADFIKDAKKSGKPFCMAIGFKAPHLPYIPDAKFKHVYEGQKYKKPANYGVENGTQLAPQTRTGRQYYGYTFWRDSEESYQTGMRRYNQLIYGVDYTIGMIRKALKKQGVADNTIIIFTGDNGFSRGEHGLTGKVMAYEAASKSPLIIYDPRAPQNKKGIKRNALTANLDMAPTILSFAGVKIPKNMDGKDLTTLIQNPDKFKRKSLTLTNMWGNDEIQSMSVVTKDWKYIYWQYSDSKIKTTEELFHISKDKLEMHNEANNPEYKNQLVKMRKLYDKKYQDIAKNAVDYNNYQKYSVLFNRKSTREDKKPYLKGSYKKGYESTSASNKYFIRQKYISK